MTNEPIIILYKELIKQQRKSFATCPLSEHECGCNGYVDQCKMYSDEVKCTGCLRIVEIYKKHIKELKNIFGEEL